MFLKDGFVLPGGSSLLRQAPAASTVTFSSVSQDATEVMYGFHSDKGMGMLKHLPRAEVCLYFLYQTSRLHLGMSLSHPGKVEAVFVISLRR